MRLVVSLGFAVWIIGAGGWLLTMGDGQGLRVLQAQLPFLSGSQTVR
jgi:hypothetical protein